MTSNDYELPDDLPETLTDEEFDTYMSIVMQIQDDDKRIRLASELDRRWFSTMMAGLGVKLP